MAKKIYIVWENHDDSGLIEHIYGVYLKKATAEIVAKANRAEIMEDELDES